VERDDADTEIETPSHLGRERERRQPGAAAPHRALAASAVVMSARRRAPEVASDIRKSPR
jgi:hypothetical protein